MPSAKAMPWGRRGYTRSAKALTLSCSSLRPERRALTPVIAAARATRRAAKPCMTGGPTSGGSARCWSALGQEAQVDAKGLGSWRTGDWRIVYRIDGQKIEILVITVGHRREVYDHVRSLLR
jgi:hypothetical protein